VAFRGTFDHTLDAKNRLTVPSKFRAALADGVVLARASSAPCLEVWPAADYERLNAAALEGMNPISAPARELKRRIYGGAFDTPLDAAGRVMVPPKLVEYAGLDREVALVGAGECLEIWDRGAWTAADEDSPSRIHELTESLEHPS
jgi:MraZ protein